MFEVRIQGRGGQGVVTAAELLSVAAFREDPHAQAFPSLGSERTGAPVVATYDRLNTWYYSDAPATVRPTLNPACRITTFDEVVGGLDPLTGKPRNRPATMFVAPSARSS